MAYKTIQKNGYTFSIDEETGTIIASGKLQDTTAERDKAVMAKTGGDMKQSTDHAGHVIAARENGPTIPENLAAQDSKLNLGTYKKVENAEYRLMQDNCEIQTEKIAYMSNQRTENGVRPDCFMVNDKITYQNGQVQEVHLSFQNMTYEDQERINQELEERIDIDNSENMRSVQIENMSPQEYEQMIEETDGLHSNIRDEFEQQIYITKEDMEGSVTMQEEWSFETEKNTDIEMAATEDWGFDAESECDSSVEGEAGVSSSVDCEADSSADIG